THENRHLDIALVVEDYNITKLKGLVPWTEGVLKKNLEQLRVIVVECGPATDTSREFYVDTIARNRQSRELIVRKVERVIDNPTRAEQCESSRVKLSNIVRVIVSMEHKLNSKVGTNIASQMRISLRAHDNTVASQMQEHNAKFPESPLTMKGIREHLIVSLDDEENVMTRFWRCVKDLYHHREHSKNLIGFYEEREERFWHMIMGHIDGLRVGEVQDAAKYLATKSKRMEAFFVEEAQGLLERVFGMSDVEGRFAASHLDQVERAFVIGVLGSQHLFENVD
ncbi:hypothetical protein HDU98_004733, partial [Podochytrium sp. JEL0797]